MTQERDSSVLCVKTFIDEGSYNFHPHPSPPFPPTITGHLFGHLFIRPSNQKECMTVLGNVFFCGGAVENCALIFKM